MTQTSLAITIHVAIHTHFFIVILITKSIFCCSEQSHNLSLKKQKRFHILIAALIVFNKLESVSNET